MQEICKTSLLIFIFLIACAETSIAAEWVLVTKYDTGSVYVDKQSLRRTGQRVEGWQKWVWTSPQEVKGSNPKKTYLVTKMQWVYLCAEKSGSVLQSIDFAEKDEASTIVNKVSFPEKLSDFTSIAPKTIGRIVMNYSCNVTGFAKQ